MIDVEEGNVYKHRDTPELRMAVAGLHGVDGDVVLEYWKVSQPHKRQTSTDYSVPVIRTYVEDGLWILVRERGGVYLDVPTGLRAIYVD